MLCNLCFPDFVPREVVEQWLKYFRDELPTVAFRCNSQHKKNAGRKSRKVVENAELLQSSNCLGAETLLQLLRNYSKNQKVGTKLQCMRDFDGSINFWERQQSLQSRLFL